jgi:hypothetical protein
VDIRYYLVIAGDRAMPRKYVILPLRVLPEDIERLERLAAQLPGGATKTGLGRDALRRGLDEIEREFLKKP